MEMARPFAQSQEAAETMVAPARRLDVSATEEGQGGVNDVRKFPLMRAGGSGGVGGGRGVWPLAKRMFAWHLCWNMFSLLDTVLSCLMAYDHVLSC